MKTRNAFFLVCAVALIGTALALFLQRGEVYQIERFPMDVEVKGDATIGFNADPGGFHFGSLNRGGSAAREFHINQVEKKSRVRFLKEGEMAAWVTAPEPFIILPNESRIVFVTINIPSAAHYGNYTGNITVIVENP